jgi:hypothetical protein
MVMGEEPENSLVPSFFDDIPPTDPAILKKMQDARTSNQHYSTIGQVAASWAYFEAVVDTWICNFMEVKAEIAVCVTGQMIGPRSRIDAFIALVRIRGSRSKWNEDLDQFAKYAATLSEQRNRAVHDIWYLTQPDHPLRREATARKTVRMLDIHEPTEKLLALVTAIYELVAHFDDMASSIFNEIHSRLKIQRPKTQR